MINIIFNYIFRLTFQSPFFMFSMLTSEKQNVSFLQLVCIAGMLGWSLYLKIALGVGSAMFSVTGLTSLHLEIFRFFTIFEKKLGFQQFLTQYLRFHHFHLY